MGSLDQRPEVVTLLPQDRRVPHGQLAGVALLGRGRRTVEAEARALALVDGGVLQRGRSGLDVVVGRQLGEVDARFEAIRRRSYSSR